MTSIIITTTTVAIITTMARGADGAGTAEVRHAA